MYLMYECIVFLVHEAVRRVALLVLLKNQYFGWGILSSSSSHPQKESGARPPQHASALPFQG